MPDSNRRSARIDVAHSRAGLLVALGFAAAALSIYASEPINLTGLKLLSALPVIWLTNSLETVRFYPAANVLTLSLATQSVGRLVLYALFLSILLYSTTKADGGFLRLCAINFSVLCVCKLMTLLLELKLARAREETVAVTARARDVRDED
jgi:hypothetical protein